MLKIKFGFDEAFNYKEEPDLDAALKRLDGDPHFNRNLRCHKIADLYDNAVSIHHSLNIMFDHKGNQIVLL